MGERKSVGLESLFWVFMGIRGARLRALARAYRRLRPCRFSCDAIWVVGEEVARGISVGVGEAADFRAPEPKERGVCYLREEQQKCMLAQGKQRARYLRQVDVN